MSGICFFRKEPGLQAQGLQCFLVFCMFRTADLTIWVQPLWQLPILPSLLHQLCSLADSLRPLAPTMKAGLSFSWFVILRQSNLAPRTAAEFDHSQHICKGDVLLSPPGILLIICGTKTLQCVSNTPMLPISSVPGHPANPVAAYKQLLAASPTRSANQQLLLTFNKKGQIHTVTVTMLARALRLMLSAMGLDTVLHSLHRLWRRGATVAYRAWADQLNIKRHGIWSSEAF